MNTIRQNSIIIIESLETALFTLMKEKNYNSISISELCNKAGVGRTSFYRYYEEKDEIIYKFFVDAWIKWCDKYNVIIRDSFDSLNAKTFFEYNYSIRNRIELVNKYHLDYIILESIDYHLRKSDNHKGFEGRFYGYALYGLLKEWCEHQFKESPEEMTEIFNKIYPSFN